MMTSQKPHVIVIGAGAVGLSTAVNIQQKLPKAKVTIIADRFTVDTTSDGAAGFFRPLLWKTPGVPLDKLRRWCKTSWKYYEELSKSPDALEAGCFVMSGYQFWDKKPDKLLYEDIVHEARDMTDRELNMFAVSKYKHGMFSTHILTEPRSYLPYLTKKFLKNGGALINRHVKSMSEFVGQCDVVVNCTGLGSRTLLNDKKVTSCRGVLVKVHAPWVKHFIYTPNGMYILPGKDFTTIGGTLDYDDYSRTPKPEEIEDILNKACEVVPALRDAPILHSWAGLRPQREPLRLEKETLTFDGKPLQVVHNYGHGGEGISLSWATGLDAADLVTDIVLQPNTKVTSKL